MKAGTRVIIVDPMEHELTEKQRKGKVVAAYGNGYKVALDAYGGGVLYFRKSQLKEDK